MGFVKHAFVLCIYTLMRCAEKPVDQAYNWVMLQTTLLAGDSDTNAAIVGGVIGAYVGVDNIGNSKREKVLECRLELAKKHFVKDRPKFIQPAKSCIDEMI